MGNIFLYISLIISKSTDISTAQILRSNITATSNSSEVCRIHIQSDTKLVKFSQISKFTWVSMGSNVIFNNWKWLLIIMWARFNIHKNSYFLVFRLRKDMKQTRCYPLKVLILFQILKLYTIILSWPNLYFFKIVEK